MALMNLWNLNDVEMCMARVIANVILTMQVKCHSLSVLSMFLYGLCKNVLETCVLRICYISTFCICSFRTLWRNRLHSGRGIWCNFLKKVSRIYQLNLEGNILVLSLLCPS